MFPHSELCFLFCCPPCPSRIAAKLAFLPPEPTYALVPVPIPAVDAAGNPKSVAPPANNDATKTVPPPVPANDDDRKSRKSAEKASKLRPNQNPPTDRSSDGSQLPTPNERRNTKIRSSADIAHEKRLIAAAKLSAAFTVNLLDKAEWAYSVRDKDKIEGFYALTSRGHRIACMHIRCTSNARYTLLFSHGNAVDLGQMSSFYLGLGARINCNIFR